MEYNKRRILSEEDERKDDAMATMSDRVNKLAAYGINSTEATERFDGDEHFYVNLVLKYLDNTLAPDLIAALEAGDFDKAYPLAHSLKGVSANMSLAKLNREVDFIDSALFNGESELALAHLPALKEADKEAREGITELKNEVEEKAKKEAEREAEEKAKKEAEAEDEAENEAKDEVS